MEKQFRESVDFVSHYYRRDAFIAHRRFVRHTGLWGGRGVAGAPAGCVLAASAPFLYVKVHEANNIPETVVDGNHEPTREVLAEVKRIEFADTPLDSVATRIEEVYGVKVHGRNSTDTMRLTLSYEGTAQDLVEAINLALDTHLSISE